MTDEATRSGYPPSTYRCAGPSCDVSVQAEAIPNGWFGVRQYPGVRDIRPRNVGLYHRPECLAEAVAAGRIKT